MSESLQTFSSKGWKTVLSIALISIAAGCSLINNTSSTQLVSNKQPLSEDNLDKQMSQTVRANLQRRLGSLVNQINIETSDGIVLLTGTINNQFNHEIAIEITKKINGVRSVIDQINISPVARTENQILDDINTALQTAQIFSDYPIDVEVDNNTVTLSGTVNLWEESEIAQRIVTQIPGVNQVNNHLLVDYQTQPTDAQIQQIIEQSLLWNNRIRASKIQVKVENGRVTLSGYVSSSREIYIAANDSYVTGVKAVNSARLIVDPRLRADQKLHNTAYFLNDLEIKETIRDTFRYDPIIGQDLPIQIKIKNGIVTLKGKVDSLIIKQAAIKSAENTVGVIKVYDELEINKVNT